MRDTIQNYWLACDKLADGLLRGFALALELDERQFSAWFLQPLTNMTLLHYPPQPANRQGHGIHPHKDTCAFTILYPDSVGGLEIRTRYGQWLDVDCPRDALLVNIGDMMELWSGGQFVSTAHRVINRSGKERYSFPYFAVPRHDVVVAPLVQPCPGFARAAVAVGPVSAEVWRTNWPDEFPSTAGYDLGTLED